MSNVGDATTGPGGKPRAAYGEMRAVILQGLSVNDGHYQLRRAAVRLHQHVRCVVRV